MRFGDLGHQVPEVGYGKVGEVAIAAIPVSASPGLDPTGGPCPTVGAVSCERPWGDTESSSTGHRAPVLSITHDVTEEVSVTPFTSSGSEPCWLLPSSQG